jgi:preprotein translocase subunit SecA
MREAERNIMLHIIDDQWKDHLLSMDHLKEGIGLRGYGQKDPLVEYKKESFTLFQDMMDRIEDETVRYLYFLRFEQNPESLPFANNDSEFEEDEEEEARKRMELAKAVEEQQRLAAQSAVMDMTRGIQKQHEKELKELQFGGTTAEQTVSNGAPKVGRNDPCPCGSGKKYKKCHGA